MPEVSSCPSEQPQWDSLRVWDVEGIPEASSDLTVLWRGSAPHSAANQLSIAQRVEDRADALRSRYLAWIHDFGKVRVDGLRVIDHLVLRPGLSYWWMSSLAQQFNMSSRSGIHDTLKAMALEELLMERQVVMLTFHSANAALAECLAGLCRSLGIAFAWSRPVKATCRSFFERLPAAIRALAYLAWYWLKALPMLMRRPVSPVTGELLFMDALVHLERQALAEGRFGSNYWTDLVSRLREWNIPCLWGHLFFRHPETRSPAVAARLVELFNRNASPGQGHFLLEAYLRPTLLLTTLRDYWRLCRAARRLATLQRPSVPGSTLDPWPLHRYEWKDSLCGKEAIRNCLRIGLFEVAMAVLPRQRMGAYIWENQPWELAMLYAWRVAGHGAIVGVPHTTVRFWDLRYHRDSRCYEPDPAETGLPLPDRLAVNGPLARESLLAGGYPRARLFEVEALRFLHLQAEPCPRQIRSAGAGLRVLVCGDFLAENNACLFAWLEIAAAALPANTTYLIKPHPAFPIEVRHYPSIHFHMRQESIQSLLGECDVVFASNTTSAAVDAFCAGVPVVQMMDGRTFNMSPLRGQPGVTYVEFPEALADALNQAQRPERRPPGLFNFDPELARWHRLLVVEGVSAE